MVEIHWAVAVMSDISPNMLNLFPSQS